MSILKKNNGARDNDPRLCVQVLNGNRQLPLKYMEVKIYE